MALTRIYVLSIRRNLHVKRKKFPELILKKKKKKNFFNYASVS